MSDYNNFNKYVDKLLENMFSNIYLRILSSRKCNPLIFKHVTLFLDGHDSKINYENSNISK